MKAYLSARYGWESSNDVRASAYDTVCAAFAEAPTHTPLSADDIGF